VGWGLDRQCNDSQKDRELQQRGVQQDAVGGVCCEKFVDEDTESNLDATCAATMESMHTFTKCHQEVFDI
jgi:hypothetical protein